MIRWDYVLGVVSTLLAIMSLSAPFFNGPPAFVIAGLIATAACIGAAWYVQLNLNLPAISVDSQTTTIVFENDRTLAKLIKKYDFRVNRKGLDHWVHRNISAEGEIADFRWNGNPVPPGDVVRRSSYVQVTVRNPYAWPVGKLIQGELSYCLKDSFKEPVEYLQYVSDMPTRLAVLRVDFPPNTSCTTAYVQRRANGVIETEPDGVLRDAQGRWLEVRISKPRAGQEYTVYWHW